MNKDRSQKLAEAISAAILCIVIWLIFTLAVQRGLWSSLETQSAQIAREFMEQKNIIVPHLNGVEDNEKPAFFYWLIALFSLFTGSVNELSSRLPGLFSLLAVISLFFLTARHLKTSSSFLLASAFFITSPKVFWMAQVARMDMVFSALCFASVCSFALYIESEQKKTSYMTGFFLFSGLAFLCKGPAGIILPALPVCFYYLKRKRADELGRFFFSKGFFIFLLITLPWYILVISKTEGRFFMKFFLSDNIGRFLGPSKLFFAQEFSKRQPMWFYIPHFLGGFFPWSFFFIIFLHNFSKNKEKYRPVDGIFLSYTLLTLLFFSIAGVKRSDYLLPLFPAAAFLVARFITLNSSLKSIRTTSLLCSAAFIAFLYVLFVVSLENWNIKESFLQSYFPEEDLLKAGFFIEHLKNIFPLTLLILVLCSGFFAYGFMKNKIFILLSSLMAIITAVLLYVSFQIVPFVNRHRDIRPFCSKIKPLINNKELWFFGFWNDEFVFYLDRLIDPPAADKSMGKDELMWIMNQKNRRVSFLIRKKDFEALKEEGIDIPYVFKENVTVLYPVYLISNVCPEKGSL